MLGSWTTKILKIQIGRLATNNIRPNHYHDYPLGYSEELTQIVLMYLKNEVR
jgi:hypothetical protein